MSKSEYTSTLDYEVEKRDIYIQSPDLTGSLGWYNKDYKKVALVNNKTEEVLSYMSPKYRLFNNHEFMALTEKIGDTLGLELAHYATHKGGRKVLSAFKQTDKKFNLLGHEFANHIILFDSRDGSTKLSIGGNGTLYRCSNMFTSTDVHFSVNHSYKLDEMLDEFKVALEMFSINQEAHLRRLERLADIPVNIDNVYDLLSGWTKVTPEEVKDVHYGKENEEMSSRKTNIIEGLLGSWSEESSELGENGFGLHNMTTHYFSNKRDKSDTDLLFGDFGKKEKQTIKFAEALEY
jgi:hypothetical protein